MKRTSSQSGFAHHFILPILAIVAVAGIGAYVLGVTHAAALNCTNKTYQTGSSGKCVQEIQQMLNGVYERNHVVDTNQATTYGGKLDIVNGQFGHVSSKYDSTTVAQVSNFQKWANGGNLKPSTKTNVSQNGNVNPATWQQLCYYAVFGEKASQRNVPIKDHTAIAYADSYMRTGVSAGLSAGCPKTNSSPTTTGSGSGSTTGGSGSTSGSGSGSSSGSGGSSPTPASSISCNYQTDTWSGDSTKVGYSVSKLSSSNGNPASFSVKLNANKGTTEVVGYPSAQCLMYSALPTTLTSSFKDTPPASSNGLDYEYAYDIWLTTATAAKANNWNNDLELMIWNDVNGQVPAGSVKATLSDGSKVWVAGNNTDGTVSVVLPQNETTGTVNLASIISQLKTKGYVTSADNGILDVEYGIEAPYGGGQTFTVNSISVAE